MPGGSPARDHARRGAVVRVAIVVLGILAAVVLQQLVVGVSG